MKTLILFFALSLTGFFAKSQNVEGNYANKWESPSGEAIEYSLNLLDDGHFIFVSVRTYLDDVPEKKVKVRGTWCLNGHLLILKTTSEDDSNKSLKSNLNMNKARFVTISPRNPNFNLVKPTLKFYQSSVFYAKNMKLIKTDTNVSLID